MTPVKSTGLSPGLAVLLFSNYEQEACPLSAEPSVPPPPRLLPQRQAKEPGVSEVKKQNKQNRAPKILCLAALLPCA